MLSYLSIKTHVYYSLKHCGHNPDILRANLDALVQHYQGNHHHCRPEARCKRDNPYIPTKTQLTDPIAITLLQNYIRKSRVYRNPEDYIYCKDTHYVESFNNALLQYHDKRICFGLKAYIIRTKDGGL